MVIAMTEEKQVHDVRPGLATVDEACEFLNISRTSLYAMMKSQDLRFVRLPGLACRRLRWADLESLAK